MDTNELIHNLFSTHNNINSLNCFLFLFSMSFSKVVDRIVHFGAAK